MGSRDTDEGWEGGHVAERLLARVTSDSSLLREFVFTMSHYSHPQKGGGHWSRYEEASCKDEG